MPRNLFPPHTGVFVFVLGVHALALWALGSGWLQPPVQIATDHVVSAQVIALQADPVPAVAAAQPKAPVPEPKPQPIKRKVLSTKRAQAEDVPKVAEAAQEMFKQNLGVEIKLANQEWKTYLETTKTHNFQMARMGWIGVFVDPVVNLDYFLGDSPNNRTGWVNEEFDRIMADSKVEQDQEKRYEMLHQAEEILMEDFPMMPIYFYTNTYLMNANIKGSANYVNRYPFMKWAEVEAK